MASSHQSASRLLSLSRLAQAGAMAALLATTGLVTGSCKDDGSKGSAEETAKPALAFDVASLSSDLAWMPGDVGSVTWFGPGRELMVSWLRSVGFGGADCDAVFLAIERSYAVDMASADAQIRIMVGPIDRAKVEACAKFGVEQGLFMMVGEDKGLRFDAPEGGGSVEARWMQAGGQPMVIAGDHESLETFLAGGGKTLGEDEHFADLIELFNAETGMWSLYFPDAKGNRWGVEHRGITMTNGGGAMRMEGRILFGDEAKRDAALTILEAMYVEASKKFGSRLRGLLESAEGTRAMVRFNLQFSDADMLDELILSIAGQAAKAVPEAGIETGDSESGGDGSAERDGSAAEASASAAGEASG